MAMSPRLLRPRATGFSPKSIANLFAWFDAADTASLFSDDAATTTVAADSQVAVWRDKSGNGYHLTQRTANNRPLWRQNFINNKPAIEFDGSNDSLALRDGSNNLVFSANLAASQALSYVAVSIGDTSTSQVVFSFKRNNLEDYTSGAAFYTTALANRFDYVFGKGSGSTNTLKYAVRSHTNTSTVFSILSGSGSAASNAAIGRYNGADQSLATPSGGTMALSLFLGEGSGSHNLCVGARGFSANNTLGGWMDGKIAELMLFTRALSASEFLRIERYLSAKYAITLS